MERIGEQQQQQRLKANQLTGCFGRAPAPVHSRSKHHMLSNAASQQALPSLVRHLCLTSHHLFTPPLTHMCHTQVVVSLVRCTRPSGTAAMWRPRC